MDVVFTEPKKLFKELDGGSTFMIDTELLLKLYDPSYGINAVSLHHALGKHFEDDQVVTLVQAHVVVDNALLEY